MFTECENAHFSSKTTQEQLRKNLGKKLMSFRWKYKEKMFSFKKPRPLFLEHHINFGKKKWGAVGGWQYMIMPNMVNKTSTVLMTFFTGCNPADRKFERHGRSPNKVVVGGAKGHRIWLVHDLNFCLPWCPIMKVSLLGQACSFSASLSPCVHTCVRVCVCVCLWGCMCVCELLSWWETGREGMCMAGLQLNHWGLCLDQGHLTTTGVVA